MQQKSFWKVQKKKVYKFITWWNVFPRALTTSPSTKRLHFAHFVPKFVWNFDVYDDHSDDYNDDDYIDDEYIECDGDGEGDGDGDGDYNDNEDEAPDNILYSSSGNPW